MRSGVGMSIVAMPASASAPFSASSGAPRNSLQRASARSSRAVVSAISNQLSLRGSFPCVTTGAGDEYLLVTMPCDGGWTVTVDGSPAEPVRVFGCLTAIPVEAGSHTVDLRYTPAGTVLGGAVSGGTLCVCAAVFFLARKKKRPGPAGEGRVDP